MWSRGAKWWTVGFVFVVGAAGCSSSEEEDNSGNGSGGATSGDGDSSSSGGSMMGSGGSGVDAPSASGGSEMTGPVDGCVIDLDCEPELLPSTGDFAQDCVNRINQFRVDCHCMEPLERWTEGEACADANAEYDQNTGQPHSGWPQNACPDESGPLSRDFAGRATNECPGYGDDPNRVLERCLLSMYHEGVEWEQQLGRVPTQDDYSDCDGGCYQSYGHFIAMTKESHGMVACGITESGDIWSVQNFR